MSSKTVNAHTTELLFSDFRLPVLGVWRRGLFQDQSAGLLGRLHRSLLRLTHAHQELQQGLLGGGRHGMLAQLSSLQRGILQGLDTSKMGKVRTKRQVCVLGTNESWFRMFCAHSYCPNSAVYPATIFCHAPRAIVMQILQSQYIWLWWGWQTELVTSRSSRYIILTKSILLVQWETIEHCFFNKHTEIPLDSFYYTVALRGLAWLWRIV